MKTIDKIKHKLIRKLGGVPAELAVQPNFIYQSVELAEVGASIYCETYPSSMPKEARNKLLMHKLSNELMDYMIVTPEEVEQNKVKLMASIYVVKPSSMWRIKH